MKVLSRAMRGVREHVRTQLVSVATVALALFCVAAAALAAENVGELSRRWGAPMRMTVYLSDHATAEQIEALRSALSGLSEVRAARYVTPSEARAVVAGDDAVLASAGAELFPATIELTLVPGATDRARLSVLSERVRRLNAVSDVETYQGITAQVQSILASGRLAAGVIALVILLCAMAVVSNTVRLSLHARMREVEVLRLVGAAPSYVRSPFLAEGALLGSGGAVVAVALLGALFVLFRSRMDSFMGGALGMRPVFLSGFMIAGFVLGGAGLGATGSALAVRRWLKV
ncbi:MAG: permease-like cell division protein FtsX [Deltaproteobacteria bacterium]|nr:permease-like cell division protein FtsX [Deltaproteobacteria bacterium]